MMFADAMRASGLVPRDIVADGRWRRCATEDKPRKRNGAYKLALDGSRGWWRNFATDAGCSHWRDAAARFAPVRSVEAADHALRELQRAAIRQMRKHWATLAPLAGGHPYLDGKGLSMRGCEGLGVDGALLVIPLRIAGRLMSLQTIDPIGGKRYRSGCPVSGAYHVIEGSGPTCLVEGFATGLAVHQCMPETRVIVCFDAVNMVKVAQSLRSSAAMVVCADNDHRNQINTGREKGAQAADILGCAMAYPGGIEGTDWCDALVEWKSPAKVRMAILRAIRGWPQAPP